MRFFAIKALGPEKHITELKEIAESPDPVYAPWAARLLEPLLKKPHLSS